MEVTAAGASLTLPSGETIAVSTENEAKKGSDAIEAESVATRKEGRDLGGWTGGSVWESSEILARVLVAKAAELVAGKRVLEVGSGCGLVGLTAAALGAEEAYLTDNVTCTPCPALPRAALAPRLPLFPPLPLTVPARHPLPSTTPGPWCSA